MAMRDGGGGESSEMALACWKLVKSCNSFNTLILRAVEHWVKKVRRITRGE